MSMHSGSFQSLGLAGGGFHRIHYTDWQAEEEALDPLPPVICVHGLTRNGRDFDSLARALSGQRRVVCPDLPGRGNSSRLSNPSAYALPTYMADLATLIAHLGGGPVDWVGTSLGGLVGMMLAAQPASPIRRLVINDVGPFIGRAALERIASYVGSNPTFEDMAEAEAYLRRVHETFGDLSAEEWRDLATHSVRPREEGGFELHYDPAIAEPYRQGFSDDVDLWAVWEAIRQPVLVIRGADSDILSRETAEEMTRRGPKAALVTFDGVGHAPMLNRAAQQAAIHDFLAVADNP